jgi:hypothetical protein
MKKDRSNEVSFVPVKRVLDIINSCETEDQLKNCLRIIGNYVRLVKTKGVSNSELVRKRLLKEYKQKKFQVVMINEYIREYSRQHSEEELETAGVTKYYRK